MIFAIGFTNLTFAEVKMDTITNWQLYKDSELLFKSHFLDSNRYTAKINSTDKYENLVLSVFYDFNNEVIDRKIELVCDNQIIATFKNESNSRSKFRIPKSEIDKLFSKNLNKEISINYSDKINGNGFTIGLLKLFVTEYTQLSIPEIRQIVQMAIDLPELQQYFHIDKSPNRKPLIFKEFGVINKNNIESITKFDTNVKFLSEEEIKRKSITEYIGIGDWTCIIDKLRLQLYYVPEGITINYIFNKLDSEWKIVESIIMEE
ncbi:hypothetical protein ESY86_15145 [Subsaximicrobium wynnwilliamsii]|uniref:Uncharacterized protein n=1 Tax=Subsaximicrobium wynnwilliamsii TaxID=291179 RepID=A0A5C6ZGN3_9FLAO|nr:hypothetical protein [Subsaximicrobium wynnwilliamsii]TXD82364.1 hypothetical protein ESY87_14735 [Subsaximicrobium wynnwilliamsii]TXD88002.1 hypothetical protein ESY86_15145 [Subsaximicrobium wynnwilliamsii]TXE01995.1 hypothetical protein ESY88_14310 [Subsaximicrobium wynnwilliamsii]